MFTILLSTVDGFPACKRNIFISSPVTDKGNIAHNTPDLAVLFWIHQKMNH